MVPGNLKIYHHLLPGLANCLALVGEFGAAVTTLDLAASLGLVEDLELLSKCPPILEQIHHLVHERVFKVKDF